MGKQTNQYTKIRNSGNTENDDLFDIDSTDDSGVSYESAKMTMNELLKLTNFTAPTYYKVNGSISEDRTLTMNGFSSVFENGTLINKAGLNDVGYLLQDSLGVEKGSLGYDVGLDSATLELKNTAGTYLNAVNGLVGIAIGNATPLEKLEVGGNVILKSSDPKIRLLDTNSSEEVVLSAQNNFNRIQATQVFNFSNGSSGSSIHTKYLPAGNWGFGGSGTGQFSATNNDKIRVIGDTDDDTKNILKLSVYDGVSVSSDLHVFRNDGNVGFGTLAPSEKLDVVGNINTSTAYKIGGVTGFTGAGAYTTLTIVGGIITNAV